jgi:hypothetical protein
LVALWCVDVGDTQFVLVASIVNFNRIAIVKISDFYGKTGRLQANIHAPARVVKKRFK